MTLTELKYIIAVAREKNFNRAAEKCFVSQPTLSIAIKKLEDQLKVSLFERGKNYIAITKIGERIVRQAQTVIEEAQKIKILANEGQDQLKEVLRIGAIHTVGPYLFPELINRVGHLAPKLPLIIEENFTANLSEKLQYGDIDVAIIATPFNIQGCKTIPVYREPFVIITPNHHEWQNKTLIHPNDFSDQKVLLLGEGNCFRDQVLSTCPACALPVEAESTIEKMLEGSSLETIRYMVTTGLGISVMPLMAIQRDGNHQERYQVKSFAEPVPHREIAIAYRDSFPRPDAIKMLIQAITSCEIDNIKWLNNGEFTC